MSIRDLLLLIVDAAGETVEGRTIAQKLGYFVSVELDRDLGYQAHFYGPFSRDVEEALALNVVAGDLEESVDRIPDWYGGPDALRHSYTLSRDGHERVEVLKRQKTDEAERVQATVQSIGQAIPNFRQQTLSAAAKIHLIITEQGRPVAIAEIPRLAGHLGWRLSQDEVNRTVDVLRRLDLVH
jgi:uncharacterized protein YwgA